MDTLQKWSWVAKTIIIITVYLAIAENLYAKNEDQLKEVVRNDIHLMVIDLVDELVFDWKQHAIKLPSKELLIARISVPAELNNVLEEIARNRLIENLINNKTAITPVHCGMCADWYIHSTPNQTIASRAIDMPEFYEYLSKVYPNQQALDLHFSAEDDELVLRAFIFRIDKQKTLLWSNSYITRQSAPRLLRDSKNLISATEARQEYLQLLNGRGILEPSFIINVRNFPSKDSGSFQFPLIEFMPRADVFLNVLRTKRLGVGLNLYSMMKLYEGWGGHMQYSFLIGEVPNLITPDFWVFTRLTYTRLRGEGANLYGDNSLDEQLISARLGEKPTATMTTYTLGLEVMAKYLFGVSTFVDYVPGLSNSKTLEQWGFGVGIILHL